jgi:NAD(P)-dependent dehydrogenase (short-subunit alcohol dehydrogenase family)
VARGARRLDGKVAVVTGASRGIGKQTCLELASSGATVVLAARTSEVRPGTPGTLDETAAAVRAVGPAPLVVRVDVAVQSDLDQLVTTVLGELGGVDILVNNAAYTVGKALWTHVPDLTREQWDKSMAVNVTAPLMLIQGFWPSMQARGGGVVVNVTSGAAVPQPVDVGIGLAGSELGENGPIYGTTKAALNRMANAIAHEGVSDRIAVINLDPGGVLTETMALTFAKQGVAPGGQMRPPEVPAKAIAYLCACADPLRYSGQVVSGPRLHDDLGL